jgi:hypothetical protein
VVRLKSQEDLAGGGGEHRGLLQSDLSGSKPRPYAMKTETNRCASAGLLRFGRRRHHAFRWDLSGDSDLGYSYRHWSCNRRWCRAQGARCPPEHRRQYRHRRIVTLGKNREPGWLRKAKSLTQTAQLTTRPRQRNKQPMDWSPETDLPFGGPEGY